MHSRLSYEIIVIDNGSADGTCGILKVLEDKYPKMLHLLFLTTNMGTTLPRNLGIKKACGQFVCIMDSDVELTRGTIEKLIDNLNQDPGVGITVPRLLYPNGNFQKSIDVFPTVFRKLSRYFLLKKMEKQEGDTFTIKHPVKADYAISALWLMKKQLFKDVGLLDEAIFYSPEDVDFCLRVWKAGYSILYDPTVFAVHHTQEISRGMKVNAALFHHAKGLIYYFLKHRYFFSAPTFAAQSD